MSRRPQELVAAWSELQRQQQRRVSERQRVWLQQQREQERQQRSAERAAARNRREQQAAYRQRRQEDARRRTDDLDRRVRTLSEMLAKGCGLAPFSPDALIRPEHLEPFSPGQLGAPVPMPDPRSYQPTQQGWSFGASRQAREQAQERFEQDWGAAQAAEQQRLEQLAAYHEQYRLWADEQLATIRQHNAGIEAIIKSLRAGEPDAVVQYFTAALCSSPGWPGDFPRQVSASFDGAGRQLILNWELPGFSVVPEASVVRYLPGSDRDKEVGRPITERRSLYRDVLAQCALLALWIVFTADTFGVVDSIALNGLVDTTDPATGNQTQIFVATVMVSRSDFDRLSLTQVHAPECLVDGLRGQLSERPDRLAGVRPTRLPGDAGSDVVHHGDATEPDLREMDPLQFEELVAELFRAMGMQAVTTKRSGDGGVDVDALDPDPIRGGKIVVQVKRYRGTVSPSAVRDLYGTMQDAGANKGVLITTSGFGPGSHAFARGKPLTLMAGDELVHLLHRFGLNGRLGHTSLEPELDLDADELKDVSVLGLSWSGTISVDVCALLCSGNRVLDEDRFVFFNNQRTPDGTVQLMPATGQDRSAVWVRFDQLPDQADRLVLVAAVAPEADPQGDLSSFTDAYLRLSAPSGEEAESLTVSEGRSGEKALVLGSFRRRVNGDWDFVPGGKGYSEGLVALVEEYGIEVA